MAHFVPPISIPVTTCIFQFAPFKTRNNINIKLTIKIPVKTGKQGKVFGSISSKQISEELKKHNLTIDKKIIEAENINILGTHLVKIKLHKKVTAELSVILEGGD